MPSKDEKQKSTKHSNSAQQQGQHSEPPPVKLKEEDVHQSAGLLVSNEEEKKEHDPPNHRKPTVLKPILKKSGYTSDKEKAPLTEKGFQNSGDGNSVGETATEVAGIPTKVRFNSTSQVYAATELTASASESEPRETVAQWMKSMDEMEEKEKEEMMKKKKKKKKRRSNVGE
ncbi:hypothetical protein CC80DRAFT_44314 [Byssothecium circinans]|uniref:Uncharacterized protein n=1 Tax=Byssothecium circinans TaxID=147558 RepID=A0A6A5TYK5_9PLEO|nr:hypothetical protein CC80DRAFT_44314 [Byssothecium circinans]